MDETIGLRTEYSTLSGTKRVLSIKDADGVEYSFADLLDEIRKALANVLSSLELKDFPDELILATLSAKALSGGDNSFDLAVCIFSGMLMAALIDGRGLTVSVSGLEPITKEDLPILHQRLNEQSYRKLISMQADMLRYIDLYREQLLVGINRLEDDLGAEDEDNGVREGVFTADVVGNDNDSNTEDLSAVRVDPIDQPE